MSEVVNAVLWFALTDTGLDENSGRDEFASAVQTVIVAPSKLPAVNVPPFWKVSSFAINNQVPKALFPAALAKLCAGFMLPEIAGSAVQHTKSFPLSSNTAPVTFATFSHTFSKSSVVLAPSTSGS